MDIELGVNGVTHRISCDPMRRLLDILRDDIGLTGTKEGCGEGECGSCSVLIDGKLANSCLVPAAQADGAEIVTIEGVGETERGRRLIESFAETHAVQCGFCTPGMIIAATALLRTAVDPTEEEIRSGLSGNICRCTGYDMIIEGVQVAAKKLRKEP